MRGTPPAAALARARGVPLRQQPRTRASTRSFNENLERLAELGWVFELQVFPNQLASAQRLVATIPT